MKPSLLIRGRASRSAGSGALKRAIVSAASFSLSAIFAWAAMNPMDGTDSTSVTAGARLFERIARNPDPSLRLAVDLFFILLFAAGGLLTLTRWVPPPHAR